MSGQWEARFIPVIRDVLATHPGATAPELRGWLRLRWDSLGLGPRRYHPYKVWSRIAREHVQDRGLIKRRNELPGKNWFLEKCGLAPAVQSAIRHPLDAGEANRGRRGNHNRCNHGKRDPPETNNAVVVST